jgi:tRNA pseudouridine32 synthase/23S rRNA pseudouridine746 synthase
MYNIVPTFPTSPKVSFGSFPVFLNPNERVLRLTLCFLGYPSLSLLTYNDTHTQELKIVFEDDHLIVVDKPSGVLCVPSQEGVPSLAQTVFDYCQSKGSPATADGGVGGGVTKMDQMVVHRLGMDTSGLVVFAKTMDAVRGMNALFRTRKITRQYQALVAGHVEKDQGLINLPLMRCYEHPPYMRISTDEHQRALVDLDSAVVGSKLLEAPKTSLTHYTVVSRESYAGNDDLPVTQLVLTSISGRTHQLNAHCAAVGHAIVGDTVYGWNGDAAANGGLDQSTAPGSASAALQEQIAAAAAGKNMCVHAKMIRFRHPITKQEVEFTSVPQF